MEEVEEEYMPQVYAPLTNTPHILELVPVNASPTDEPEPNLEPAAIASRPNTHTRPAPHINNLGAGSSRSVDPTTAAPVHSLPTPEDLFYSLREPSSSRPKPVPGSVDVQHSMFNSPSLTEMNIKLPINKLDELPQPARAAFAEASMYNIMMVAHARTTRIKHLFSEKTTKVTPDEYQATSQKYSKDNVAIFAQDVVSLPQYCHPP
ncbi:hypothetical protein C8R44DRAFT_881878 [Mycena epipterygia]|nr:hypothetical protein C8R44DRAFT_881878 [Mycena epipterygia]